MFSQHSCAPLNEFRVTVMVTVTVASGNEPLLLLQGHTQYRGSERPQRGGAEGLPTGVAESYGYLGRRFTGVRYHAASEIGGGHILHRAAIDRGSGRGDIDGLSEDGVGSMWTSRHKILKAVVGRSGIGEKYQAREAIGEHIGVASGGPAGDICSQGGSCSRGSRFGVAIDDQIGSQDTLRMKHWRSGQGLSRREAKNRLGAGDAYV